MRLLKNGFIISFFGASFGALFSIFGAYKEAIIREIPENVPLLEQYVSDYNLGLNFIYAGYGIVIGMILGVIAIGILFWCRDLRIVRYFKRMFENRQGDSLFL